MNKKVITIWFIIGIFIISIFIGIYIFKILNLKENVEEKTYISKVVQEENSTEEIITTTSQEEKITPSTKLVLRKYYEGCGHTINEYVEMPKELINMTKKELQEQYKDWSVYVFSKEEVILIKTVNEYCNQHYFLRELDGYIAIYKINKNGEEILQEKTSIATRYLTQTDLSHLQGGIKIYGIENLNKYLEDFE